MIPAPPRAAFFTAETFRFLRELARDNRREWFLENRERYERHVRAPALALIVAFAPRLARLSPHFVADPRPQGGSLFRIHRDVRFSRDKSPYKTHVGIHFRHERAADVHAPGFYFHLEPGSVFAALGIWCPPMPVLRTIREALVADPDGWRAATRGRAFRRHWQLESEMLARVPRGYPADHPLAEDLRRKSFTGVCLLEPRDALGADLPRRLEAAWGSGAPMMAWLCRALGVEF